jgi:hypothetical protein
VAKLLEGEEDEEDEEGDASLNMLGVCPRGYHRDECIALYP